MSKVGLSLTKDLGFLKLNNWRDETICHPYYHITTFLPHCVSLPYVPSLSSIWVAEKWRDENSNFLNVVNDIFIIISISLSANQEVTVGFLS